MRPIHKEVNDYSQGLKSIYNPEYRAEPLFFGSDLGRTLTSVGLALIAGAYGYFNPITWLNPNISVAKIATGFIAMPIAGFLTDNSMKILTPKGDYQIARGQEGDWLKDFDKNLRAAGMNESSGKITKLYALGAEAETQYKLRHIDDIGYFQTAFPNSSRYMDFLLEGLPYLQPNQIDDIGQKYSGLFNHNEAVQRKIREIYFSRQSTIKQCVEMMQTKYPQSQDLAEARAAEIAIATNTNESYVEFFKAFSNGQKRTAVLSKAHVLMRKQLADCILPTHYRGFLDIWDNPQLRDARTIEEAKKLYAKALDEQKKYYNNPITFQITGGQIRTGIYVPKGSRIQISSEGVINVESGFICRNSTAEGHTDGSYSNYSIFSNFYHGALLCRIGGSDWFATGNAKKFLAPDNGMISLQINDYNYCNNNGQLTVAIAGESLQNDASAASAISYPGDETCRQQEAEYQARRRQDNERYKSDRDREEAKKASERAASANEEAIIQGARLESPEKEYDGTRYDLVFPDGVRGKIYHHKDGTWCTASVIVFNTYANCYSEREKAIRVIYQDKKR